MPPTGPVSIPSSSGHQFTADDFDALMTWGVNLFQSLLHQGISLLRGPGRGIVMGLWDVSIPSSSGHQFTGGHHEKIGAYRLGFNPFFIRASVYWASLVSVARRNPCVVSIPSSSGHQFTVVRLTPGDVIDLPEFQSLLHQGISLLAELVRTRPGRSVDFVSIPSSSGHQFTGPTQGTGHGQTHFVSIPSSSGHQFTE